MGEGLDEGLGGAPPLLPNGIQYAIPHLKGHHMRCPFRLWFYTRLFQQILGNKVPQMGPLGTIFMVSHQSLDDLHIHQVFNIILSWGFHDAR